jgi:outer membrane protein
VNFRILAPAQTGSFKLVFSIVTVMTAACFGVAPAIHGQGAPTVAAAGNKVGVINARQAIASTSEGKQAGAELQTQFSSRQNELENLNKQINDLRQRLDAGRGKISADEEARLTRDGQKLTQQLDRKQNEYQEDVNSAQADVFDRIGRKMLDVLDRYARDNGYVVILDSSAQNNPLLYASTAVDVTQDIVKLYDQAYPVKGPVPATSTPPTRPTTTPRPAQQPPAQKPPR